MELYFLTFATFFVGVVTGWTLKIMWDEIKRDRRRIK